MFKKINSDKNQPNFLTEVKKEFSGHFTLVNLKFKVFCEKHPKQIFIGMVAMILISMIISFTVIVPMEKRRLAAELIASQKRAGDNKLNTVRNLPGNNIGSVIAGIGKMKTTLQIKQRIDEILLKKHLTRTDSVNLNLMLDSIKLNTTGLTKQ